jgi:hypothetical protein
VNSWELNPSLQRKRVQPADGSEQQRGAWPWREYPQPDELVLARGLALDIRQAAPEPKAAHELPHLAAGECLSGIVDSVLGEEASLDIAKKRPEGPESE